MISSSGSLILGWQRPLAAAMGVRQSLRLRRHRALAVDRICNSTAIGAANLVNRGPGTSNNAVI